MVCDIYIHYAYRLDVLLPYNFLERERTAGRLTEGRLTTLDH
jgi:hypothetical protein